MSDPFAILFKAFTTSSTLLLVVSTSAWSFCPRYCLPSQIAIVGLLADNSHWFLLRLAFPPSLFCLKTREKGTPYVSWHHLSMVFSVTSSTAHISSLVHWILHRFSNCFWFISFFGLPIFANSYSPPLYLSYSFSSFCILFNALL